MSFYSWPWEGVACINKQTSLCVCGDDLRSKGWKWAFVLKKVKELGKEANATEEVGTTCLK